MCSATSAVILPEPPQELKQLSQQLAEVIREKIREHGPIPFSDYMEMALYQPGLGYYSAGLKKFGSGGDFVTAPELGDLFARCVASQIEQIGVHLGSYEIIEAGAGSGTLAADLLSALSDKHPPTSYRILERSAHLRQVQKETLQNRVPQWMDRISWLDEPPEHPWQGVFLANEVLDALTVERFCIQDNNIQLAKSGFTRRNISHNADGALHSKSLLVPGTASMMPLTTCSSPAFVLKSMASVSTMRYGCPHFMIQGR